MNKIKLFLIILIFTIISNLFCFSSDRKKSYVNLEYFTLPKSSQFKGKISIRNINDLRDEKEGKGDFGFLGYIDDHMGRYLEIRATEDKKIDKILKNLVIDALNIAGFDNNTTSEEKDKYPVLDINLKKFYCDGMGRYYGIYITFELILYASNSNKILIKKELNIFTGFGIYSGDYDFKKTDFIELYDNYKWSSNKILIESIVFFETDLFYNAYKGEIIYSNFDVILSKKNLSNIPQDINNKNQVKFLDLDKNNISKIENLDNFNNLLSLNLQRNNINKLENLNNLKNLKILSLRFNNISKIENLDYLENLICLDLSYCKVKKLENIDNLNNLKYIFLFPYKDPFETIDIKTIDEKTYNFLKNKGVLINNGITIDEFVNTKNIKIVKIESKSGDNRTRNHVRINIKKSLTNALAYKGDSFRYYWKMKINKDITISNNSSTYFFSLLPCYTDSRDIRISIISLNAIKLNNNDILRIYYVPEDNKRANLLETDFSKIKGRWIQLECIVRFGDNGYIMFTIKDLAGNILASLEKNNLFMWKEDAIFFEPYFQFYRDVHDSMNTFRPDEEAVYFADLTIQKIKFK